MVKKWPVIPTGRWEIIAWHAAVGVKLRRKNAAFAPQPANSGLGPVLAGRPRPGVS